MIEAEQHGGEQHCAAAQATWPLRAMPAKPRSPQPTGWLSDSISCSTSCFVRPFVLALN
jgi:hypothetical protein